MSGILDSCEKYFGTRNLYEILDIPKQSLEKDIKKAYYKISLKVHPDRVPDDQKEVSTEKFKVLAKVHQVLTDKSKRVLYDEKGIVENEDEEANLSTWLELWQKIFKPLTTEDIDNYQKEYTGSDLEKADIQKAYLNGKGCINYIFNCVPFIGVEDEPRLKVIVQEMIDSGQVPEFKIFTHEPAAKRKRRHQKYARERIEADEIKKKIQEVSNVSLEDQIMRRQRDRQNTFSFLLDRLVEKYGDDDGEDAVDFEDLEREAKKKKKKKAKARAPPKAKERLVRNGKVKKNRA